MDTAANLKGQICELYNTNSGWRNLANILLVPKQTAPSMG